MVARCQYRPIAHVVAEADVSWRCLSEWVARRRWRRQGVERSVIAAQAEFFSRPPTDVVGVNSRVPVSNVFCNRIAHELATTGNPASVSTASGVPVRHGVNRLRHLDSGGPPLRAPGRIAVPSSGILPIFFTSSGPCDPDTPPAAAAPRPRQPSRPRPPRPGRVCLPALCGRWAHQAGLHRTPRR